MDFMPSPDQPGIDPIPLDAPPPSDPDPSAGHERRRIMADAGKLSGAVGLGYFINLVGGFIIARILGPVMLGIWGTVQLAVQYTQFADFGSSFGVQKLSPAYVTKGWIERYRKLIGVSLGFSLVLPLIASGGLIVAAFLVSSAPARVALLALALVVPIQQFYHHAELALAVEKRFGTKAKALFSYTLVRVSLSIALALVLNLAGVLIGYIVTLIGVSYYMIRKSRMGLQLALRWRFAKKLIVVGLPITLIVVGELLLGTADKWVVAGILGPKAMGLYRIVVFPLPVLMLLPVSLRQVVNIEVFDKFGHTHDVRTSRKVYEDSTLIVAMVAPVVIGAVYLGVPWLVNWLLTSFRESIPALKLHSILIFSLLIMQTGTGVLIVSGRERQVFASQLAVALLSAMVSIGAIWFAGAGFLTVLAIHGAGWFVYGTGFAYATARFLGLTPKAALGKTVFWFLPMAFVAVELPLLTWGMERLGAAPNTFLLAAGGGLVHLAICSPLLIHLERRTHAVSDGIRMVLRRLGF